MNYEKSRQRSFYIHQFKCWCRKFPWWGPKRTSTCNNCRLRVKMLPTKNMVGIGWFECTCKNRYADLAKGDIQAKCPICGTSNYAQFIVSDTKKEVELLKNIHFCSLCNGSIADCDTIKVLLLKYYLLV